MKTVLVVSYHFLPVHNVGVKQFANYCRYLPQAGWRPVVLTRDWSGGLLPEDAGWGLSFVDAPDAAGPETVIRTAPYAPYRNRVWSWHEGLKRGIGPDAPPVSRAVSGALRRAASPFWPLFGPYPDAFTGWIPAAVEEGARIIRDHDVRAIVSNCPPETNHVVASTLARRFGLLWVPYFGDLYGYYVGPGDWHGTPWRRALVRRMNRRWLRPASRALVVSPRMGRLVEEEYGVGSEVVVVGYDEADFAAAPPAANEKLRISHVGSVYPGDQRPEIFLAGLDRLLEQVPEAAGELEVVLVGSKVEAELREMVAGRPSEAVCTILPKVPPDEAIHLQRRSDVLLLFNLTNERAREGTLSYPSKVFEYLAAGRPILSVPGDGDWVDRVVARADGGRAANTPGEVAAVLGEWYRAWKAEGRVPYGGKPEEIAEFSHRRLAARIGAVLDRVSG